MRSVFLAGLLIVAPMAAWCQLPSPAEQSAAPNPLTDPTANPGKVLLFDLEARFAKDVLERGGAAFADWFAEDGVALGNGQLPAMGLVAIVKSANWSAQGLSAHLDSDRCADGAVGRYRLHLGSL